MKSITMDTHMSAHALSVNRHLVYDKYKTTCNKAQELITQNTSLSEAV